jgi:hypothetical protein
MNDAPDVNDVTNDALNIAEREARADEDVAYGNPLADPTHGMSQNWDKHLIRENAVAAIKSMDSVAEGVAKVSEGAIQEMYDRNPEMAGLAPFQIVGVYKTVAARFGLGAAGERYFEGVLEARGETVKEAHDGDENAGIDIRTGEATYQVKTADSKRYDWNAKEADHLIWVKPGDGWTKLE